MLYRLAADLTVLLHSAFVLFVVFGGLLVLVWRRLVWVHVPVAVWGAAIEFIGFICPLTPLENYFRRQAGLAEYHTSFVERYILPVLYPAELTRTMQLVLGAAVVAVNVGIYTIVVKKWNRDRTKSKGRR